LLFAELQRNLLHVEVSGLLRLFDQLLLMAFVAFVCIWIKTYHVYLTVAFGVVVMMLAFLLVLGLFAFLIGWALKKIPWLADKGQQTQKLRWRLSLPLP
jgi:hypothetical protein